MSTERMPDRKRLLDTAAEYVLKERNKSYGEPDEDFQRIAKIASAMGFRFAAGTGENACRELSGSDVALFMIALKASRLAWAPEHEDSWIDIAGYAACGMETANLQRGRETLQSNLESLKVNMDAAAKRPTFDRMPRVNNNDDVPASIRCGPVCHQGHTYVGSCKLRRNAGNSNA